MPLPLRMPSRAIVAALILSTTFACVSTDFDDDDIDENTGSSSAEITYDRAGRAYTAKFEILARARLTAKAQDEQGFHDVLSFVYGDYDAVRAEALRQQMVAGDFSWAPDIQLVPTRVLKGAAAAYSEDTGLVYLSEDVPNRIQRTMVYLEEIGHHLDVILKSSDTPGDEGGLFRMAIFGAPISAELEAELRAENDHGTIFYRGQRIEVEFFFLFDWLEDAWEGIVDAWEWASPRVFWAFVDQFAIAYDGIKTLGVAFEDGGLAIASGLVKFSEGDFSGGLKDLFEGALALSVIPVASMAITIILHEVAAIQHLVFGGGRKLTSEEKTKARLVFGDRWWIDVVRVVEGKTAAGVFMVSPDPFTTEFTIYLKDAYASKRLIIHELTHSFQFASGDGTYKLMSVYDRITKGTRKMYDWKPPANEGKLFPELLVEQQAAFVEDAFGADCFELEAWQQCYIGSRNRTELFNSARRSIASGIWFNHVMPPALTTVVIF